MASRVETAPGVLFDIAGASQVLFPARVQAGNPAPRKGVGSWVAVAQMPEEESRSELPGQSQGKHPNTGEPHARMVVQVTGLHQLCHPEVETLDAGLPVDRPSVILAQFVTVIDGHGE